MKRTLARTPVLLFFCWLFAIDSFAQNITITGVVTDGLARASLPGVSVIVKGSTNGTNTDASGKYTISAPANGTLVFTYIGYTTFEAAIRNQQTINATLEAATQSLNQVVVIGYGTQRKRDNTGSISSIKGTDIEKITTTNPIAALQGKVPGLTVVNTGAPGSSPTVRIRGISSTNSADPLYVVDGLLQDNIDFLNPNDIETIDLLRDASSTAIYGLRGANGVIAITTKRAARGKTVVSFQTSFGVQRVISKMDVADAAGFKKLYNAQLANLGAAAFDYTNYTANTDWQSLILRDAMINTNNLSVSNNSEKSTTLLNVGYNNQDGVVKYGNYKKIIVRLNEEIRINSHIRVGADITGFHWRQEPTAANLNSPIYAAPISPVQDPATGYYYTLPSFQRAQVGNLLYAIERSRGNSINRGYRLNGSVFAELKVAKRFTWKSTFYTDLGFNNARSYSGLPYTVINLGEGINPTTTFFDNTVRTSVSQNTFEGRKYQQDHTLAYDIELKGGHRLNVLAGFTSVYSSSTTLGGSRTDTALNVPFDPNLWYLNIINANNPTSNSGGGGEESNEGFFGRVSYAYNNRYLFNGTIRRDGSSKFAPQNRWGTFGSVGLGWVISEENFFKNVEGINFLKLRAAWGRLGNSNGFPGNLYQQTLSNAATAVFGNNIYTAVTNANIVDSNLHYEIVQGTDVGLEFRTLGNRLTGEIGFYNKTTDGIFSQITLINSNNVPFFTNLGKNTNKGVEVSLSYNDKIGKDFRFTVSGNFSYNKNIVNSLGPNINFSLIGNAGANLTETGRSIGYFYGYKQIGIYQTTSDLDKQPHLSTSLPGDIAYADINGDGQITTADRTYLGTPFPPYSFGGSLSMSYKGFDATVDVNGVAGNKIYLQRRVANFAVLNYEANRLNAWTTAGSTNVEPILDNSRGNNYLFSSYYLEPGDYFRLRNIQVGYTFPTNLVGKAGIQKLRIYISGQNLKTWSKTTGYSPEAPISTILGAGADNGVYPVPAVYTAGINVTF